MVVVQGLAAFDGMAVIAALPSIAADLGDVSLLPWVSTAYLGTSAVAVLIGGPVIDAIGVRRTFRITGMWFLCSSAAVAVMPNMPLLVAVRVAHGFGMAGEGAPKPRMIGTLVTMLTLLGLAVVAVLITLGVM